MEPWRLLSGVTGVVRRNHCSIFVRLRRRLLHCQESHQPWRPYRMDFAGRNSIANGRSATQYNRYNWYLWKCFFFAQDSLSTKLTFIYIVCLTWSEPSSSSEARIQPTQMQDRFLHISRELHLTYLVSRACLYKVDQYRIFQWKRLQSLCVIKCRLQWATVEQQQLLPSSSL